MHSVLGLFESVGIRPSYLTLISSFICDLKTWKKNLELKMGRLGFKGVGLC